MKKKEIEKNYNKKINQLKKYNKAYFKNDNPIVSDKDYDNLKKKVLELEKKYSFFNKQKFPKSKCWL